MVLTVKLNLINKSNDQNNSDIVIFQKNVADEVENNAVAWKVIGNCGKGWNHHFNFPLELSINATDSRGNTISAPVIAKPGHHFRVFSEVSGNKMEYSGAAYPQNEVQLRNDLPQGSINANIYRDGKLLATKTNISPGQKAAFQLKPSLLVGVVSQVEEGQLMNSAILSDINTELSLLGIASADIVMTGGGSGQGKNPFQFTLENIVFA